MSCWLPINPHSLPAQLFFMLELSVGLLGGNLVRPFYSEIYKKKTQNQEILKLEFDTGILFRSGSQKTGPT